MRLFRILKIIFIGIVFAMATAAEPLSRTRLGMSLGGGLTFSGLRIVKSSAIPNPLILQGQIADGGTIPSSRC